MRVPKLNLSRMNHHRTGRVYRAQQQTVRRQRTSQQQQQQQPSRRSRLVAGGFFISFVRRFLDGHDDRGAMFSSLKLSSSRSKKQTSRPKHNAQQRRRSTSRCERGRIACGGDRRRDPLVFCFSFAQGCWTRCARRRRTTTTNGWCPNARSTSPAVGTRINVRWSYLYV